MTQQFELDLQVEALTAKIQHLEAELRTSQRLTAKMLETIELQQQQLRDQQTSISRLDRIQMEMLTSRVWRSLRALTEAAKKVLPVRDRNTEASIPLSKKKSFLVCDEPHAGDKTLRSGVITIRGWCLAEGGVDYIRVEIAGADPLQVKPNVARPDVRKAHPDLDQTGRAGFVADIDSSVLQNGVHAITLRVFSEGIAVREAHTTVVIDHEKGFASEYDRWIHDFEAPDDRLIGLKVAALKKQPLISIVMPVFNTHPAELTAAIESVFDQS